MFCSKCGAEIDDDALICPKCGCGTANYTATNTAKETSTSLEAQKNTLKTLGTLSIVFSLLIPIVGLVFAIVLLVKLAGVTSINEEERKAYQKKAYISIAIFVVVQVVWVLSLGFALWW